MLSTPMERLLSRLPDARRSGKNWSVCCPAHDDRTASLSLGVGDDGRALIHCHAGCTTDDVCRAIGITVRDLMPERDIHAAPYNNGKNGHHNNGHRRILSTYDYHDEDGTLLYQAVRYHPKDFRQRRPDGKGGWNWSVKGVRVVPYRLPELLADPEQTVYVVEGEKDANNLAGIGIVATCNAGGAGKWRADHAVFLEGRHVVALPDNDSAGRDHAEQVARTLRETAASVRIVELPGLTDKQDVSDWLAAGGTREQLEQLAEAAEEWIPPPTASLSGSPSSNGRHRDAGQDAGGAIRNSAAPREMDRARIEFCPIPASKLGDGEQIDWIWHGYLARGYTTLLVGLWKAGKSTLLAHLLKAMGVGGDLAGAVRPAKALVITEEGSGLWARRRDDVGITDHAHFAIRPFKSRPNFADWNSFISQVAATVREHRFDAVVFDTWQSMSPTPDENDAAGMMGALSPLHAITEANAGILLVHHPRKGDATEGQASRGSGALPGFVDTIVELRRFNAQEADDRRRKLRGHSRFEETSAEVVIELANDGYKLVGSTGDANRTDRQRVIADILTEADWQSTEAIRERWPEGTVPKPSKRTVQLDLNNGFDDGKWQREGKGAKGDPFRYGFDSRTVPPLRAQIESESDPEARWGEL